MNSENDSNADTRKKVNRILIAAAIFTMILVPISSSIVRYYAPHEKTEQKRCDHVYNVSPNGIAYIGKDKTDGGSVFAVGLNLQKKDPELVHSTKADTPEVEKPTAKKKLADKVIRIKRCVKGDYTVGFPYYMPKRLQDAILPPSTNGSPLDILSDTNKFVMIDCPVYTNCVVKHYAYVGKYEPSVEELKETIRDLLDRKAKKENQDGSTKSSK